MRLLAVSIIRIEKGVETPDYGGMLERGRKPNCLKLTIPLVCIKKLSFCLSIGFSSYT